MSYIYVKSLKMLIKHICGFPFNEYNNKQKSLHKSPTSFKTLKEEVHQCLDIKLVCYELWLFFAIKFGLVEEMDVQAWFYGVTKYCGTKTRKFLHTVTIWGHMDHKLLSAYFTCRLQMALSHHREGSKEYT